MTNISVFLTILYILITEVFVLIMMYPVFKDTCRDILPSPVASEVITVCIILAALVYGFFVMFYMVTFFIGSLSILIAMASGFGLISLSRSFKINFALFMISLMLIILSLTIHETAQIVSILNGVIYLIGIGEDAGEYLLPLFKDFYAKYDGESYAEGLTTLFIIICILTVVLPWIDIKIPEHLQAASHISDIAFIIGGLMGYITLRFMKGKCL